ncbi:recombinase family protein [Alkaliphilus peptidifermentans]|uniref:Site-specific DNA recombinase n=1 Tax=Alkaliphilus peptidifermentans DSM 18978 TaxID=1120976 RepID=A0A1G5BE66_9FIRM|nr:recombinase family protein [Alkaliphilus peptidifermentans]SCX88396.1 Site-specific DNA recombinase [Alkaliphilus peptidifermentans DSM 18978]
MKVYGYVRLSRDEDKENYSSILQQRNIIHERARELGYEIAEIYEDDNISGYSFDRPGLNRLIEEINQGEVAILIVKDSSRIGRHNAKTLLFFELLKENDVRLILATENYDSKIDNDDLLGLRTWYNEMYIKDISRKITENIRSKQKNGGLVIKSHFGYVKDANDKHKLLIDEEAAEIIRMIFARYIEGLGYRKISDELNLLKLPTPSQYLKKQRGGKFKTASKWSSVHVQRIITNDFYMGTLRCGKTRKKKIKGASYLVEEDKQIIYENHHPAIISKEDFLLSRQINERRNNRKIRGGKRGINLFSGFVYCNECGSYMIARKRKNHAIGYYCGEYHKHGRKACTTHYVSEENLKTIISTSIKQFILCNNLDVIQIKRKVKNIKKNSINIEKRIEKLYSSIDNKKDEAKNYIRLWAKNQLEDELYQEIIYETYADLNNMKAALERLLAKKDLHRSEDTLDNTDFLDNFMNDFELQRDDIELLIEKIVVKQNDSTDLLKIVIIWSFKDPMCISNQVDVKLDLDR